ncbi:ubiquitin carboxyl-terminal hydrolase 8-like [Coccinella septempunctata]|uniref:ubiquitin carboxyl-terminal hydrolase 8-like n=1 Tax=Coccinella septempunctata TaxID=41139 RepID=UPI001D067BCA|nr:ubiquitin carboxyl-terminal hydrolase 8-like [Coccinella septempunctata]
MTVNHKELYIADNIDALNVIAKDRPLIKGGNFDSKMKNLEKLYKSAQDNFIDQEKAYIFLFRFLLYYAHYSRTINDTHFMEIRFESQLKKARRQLEALQKDLTRRYSERKVNENENRSPFKKTSLSSVPIKKFPDNEIKCEELYLALQDPKNNILIVDARSRQDFKESRIKEGTVINVPDDIIQSGLSAHCIGEVIPEEFKPVWQKRDTFDIVVLLDWKSTSETMAATKLEKLLSSLVDWDTNRTYSQKPIILRGGYMEWGQKYPSLCINSNVVMNKVNDELDELLDLDNIQYPSEETKEPSIPFKEPNAAVESGAYTGTREDLIQKNKELAKQCEIILNEIIAGENRWKEETDIEKRLELEKTIANLDKKFEVISEEKNKTQELFELYARFDPQKESLKADHIKEIADIDKSENRKILIRQTIAQQRLDVLAKARALKPKAAGDPTMGMSPSLDSGTGSKEVKPVKPVINRATKPTSLIQRSHLFDGPLTFNPDGGGLIGLRNIRNTCYMNTVVQCMKSVPQLAALFCTGSYSVHVRRKPDAIIIETAFLFRSLWSNIQKCFNPIRFYEKVGSIEPTYKMGNHEDCMEFFLFLLNNLSEDCAYDITKPDMMSPAQQAWFTQLGGRTSFFDIFYHQIRITQVCNNCNITSLKFEMESTFMLPVPEDDFRVEDLMRNYMQDYIIDDYCCSKCKQPVTNSKKVCVAPEILVIVLKRYKQTVRNNNVSVSKVDSRVSFPTRNFHFGGCTYTLNSIAMHSGSMTSGHYTAACFINFKWYEFNDELVRPVSLEDDALRVKACAFFYSKD